MLKIVENRIKFLVVSGILFCISILLLLVGNLNLGIDMTGGIQMDYTSSKVLNTDELKERISEYSKEIVNNGKPAINNTVVYKVAGENTIVVVAGFFNGIDEESLELYKGTFRERTLDIIQEYDKTTVESRYINIGKSFGDYIRNTAFLTIGIALIAITIYVTWAFSGVVGGISVGSFSIITVITLFHDVIISSGLYIFVSKFLPQFQIDTFFITALLTILGYSINDTIVIFDRIRSNLKKFGGKKGKDGKNLEDIIDISVNETLTRSIYTSLTLFFVLITIFLFGPETISGFMLVMIFGTIVGTYSSIFIASPLLYIANKNKILSIYKKVESNPEDKIVV